MTAVQNSTVSIAFTAIKEWFGNRITRSECERQIGAYASAEELGRIMATADRNKATVQHMAWQPLTEAAVAKAYFGN